MMTAMPVSLGGRSLEIPSVHARLKQCPRGYDSSSTHNPESLEERGRGNGPETRPGAKPSKRGDVAPNLPALKGKGSR